MEIGGHSDICTPFYEKQWFLKVPGLPFSHILCMFKQLPFESSLFHVFGRLWVPLGFHFGAWRLPYATSFFRPFFRTSKCHQNDSKWGGGPHYNVYLPPPSSDSSPLESLRVLHAYTPAARWQSPSFPEYIPVISKDRKAQQHSPV